MGKVNSEHRQLLNKILNGVYKKFELLHPTGSRPIQKEDEDIPCWWYETTEKEILYYSKVVTFEVKYGVATWVLKEHFWACPLCEARIISTGEELQDPLCLKFTCPNQKCEASKWYVKPGTTSNYVEGHKIFDE